MAGIIAACWMPSAAPVDSTPAAAIAADQVDEVLAPVLSSLLARLNEPAANAALYDLLSSGNVMVRRAAVVTVSAIGGRTAQNTLAHLANRDPDSTVRGLCALFLKQ